MEIFALAVNSNQLKFLNCVLQESRSTKGMLVQKFLVMVPLWCEATAPFESGVGILVLVDFMVGERQHSNRQYSGRPYVVFTFLLKVVYYQVGILGMIIMHITYITYPGLYMIGYGTAKIILKFPPFFRLKVENQEQEIQKIK